MNLLLTIYKFKEELIIGLINYKLQLAKSLLSINQK